MNTNNYLNGIGLIAIILGLYASPQAEARDYSGQMQSVQMQTVANLNTQRANIETKVSNAFSRGQISASQADSIRAQLSQSTSLQNRYLADGIIDVSETQAVINSLNGIDSGVDAQIQAFTSSTAPFGNLNLNSSLGSSNRYGNYNNGFNHNNHGNHRWNRPDPQFAAKMTTITNLQTRISTQLDTGRSNGLLTRGEYRSLKSDLSNIEERTQRLADSRGRRFNFDEPQNLISQLNALQTRVTQELRDADRNVAGQRNYGRRWY